MLYKANLTSETDRPPQPPYVHSEVQLFQKAVALVPHLRSWPVAASGKRPQTQRGRGNPEREGCKCASRSCKSLLDWDQPCQCVTQLGSIIFWAA